MKVEITTTSAPSMLYCTITARTKLDCEVLETLEDGNVLVKILQAGAGLALNETITIPASKVTEE